MKLTIKTVTQKVFTVEADPSETVRRPLPVDGDAAGEPDKSMRRFYRLGK